MSVSAYQPPKSITTRYRARSARITPNGSASYMLRIALGIVVCTNRRSSGSLHRLMHHPAAGWCSLSIQRVHPSTTLLVAGKDGMCDIWWMMRGIDGCTSCFCGCPRTVVAFMADSEIEVAVKRWLRW
uniref:Uncharacterized protein n=1 Tax=Coccolithus braarudii TaxID=221442 RepID=A0A7S0Q0B7_9EUKA